MESISVSSLTPDELLQLSPTAITEWIHSGAYADNDGGANWLGLAEGAILRAHRAESVGNADIWQQVATEALGRAHWISGLPARSVVTREINMAAGVAHKFSAEPDSAERAERIIKRFLESLPFTPVEVGVLVDYNNRVRSKQTTLLLRRLTELIKPLSLIVDLATDADLRHAARQWVALLPTLP